MRMTIALVGILALVGIAHAAQITEIAPDGLSAKVYDADRGIMFELINTDNTTDFDANGLADSVWDVLVSNDNDLPELNVDGKDWTNARFETQNGLNCWDSGDLFGGFVKAYQTQDAFIGNEFKDPTGNDLSLAGNAVWPSLGNGPARGPLGISFFHTSTDDVELEHALNGRLIIPDNEVGTLRILEIFGADSIAESFTVTYDANAQKTYIPEPAAFVLLALGTLAMRRR